MPKSKVRKSGKQKKYTKADNININAAYSKKIEEFSEMEYEDLLTLDSTNSVKGTYNLALKHVIASKKPAPIELVAEN